MDNEEVLPGQSTVASDQTSLEQDTEKDTEPLLSSISEEQPDQAVGSSSDIVPDESLESEQATQDTVVAVISPPKDSDENLKDASLSTEDVTALTSSSPTSLEETTESLENQPDSVVSSAGSTEANISKQGDKTLEQVNEQSVEDPEKTVEDAKKPKVQPTRRTTRTRKANTKYIEEEDFEEGSKDPLFSPEDGEYFEGSPEVSGESEEDFVVGKAKKKSKVGGRGRKRSISRTPRSAKKKTPKGRGRKPAAVKSSSKNQARTPRPPRRKISKTTYFEEDSENDVGDDGNSDEDYGETLTEHKPTSKHLSRKNSSSRKPQKLTKSSPPPARRRSTPRRESANHRSYDESLLGESSDDEELLLVDGQPQLKPNKSKSRSRQSRNNDPNEEMEDQPGSWNNEEQGGRRSLKQESCFMVKKDSHAALQTVIYSNGQAHLNEDLYIWKQEGQLLQKFLRMGDSPKFKATSNYLGFFAESKNDFLPIEVWSLAKEKAMEVVKLKGPFDSNGDADVPESHRIKNSMESGLAGKPSKTHSRTARRRSSESYEPARRHSGSRKASDDFVAEPTTKRKSSTQDDSATPRKRGRPKKNAVVAIEKLDEPMEAFEAKSGNDMKPAFLEYVKVLLNQIGLGKNRLEGMNDPDILKLSEIDNLLLDLSEKVINIRNLNADYLEALRSRPDILQEPNTDGQQCQATSDGSNVAAALVVVLSGKAYIRDALVVSDDEEDIVKKFFVCDTVGKISQAYHNLHHFKFHLFDKCSRKLKENASEVSADQSMPVDLLDSAGKQIADLGQTAEDASGVSVKTAVNDVLLQVMQQSCLGDLGAGEVVEGKVVKTDMPVKSAVQNCLEDKMWIDQLCNHFLAILAEAEDLLTESHDDSGDVTAPL